MKINKKLVTSSLATTMAISLAAAISGTVAWYQYNTRVTTSIIGTSVADTGVLQISTDETNWERDLVTADLIGAPVELTPVTFGAMNADGSLPATAYKKPDASKNGLDGANPGSYTQVYQTATLNQDYLRYTVYLRAMEVNDDSARDSDGLDQVEKDVYLTNITFANLNASGHIAEGLRAHLAIDLDNDGNNDKYLLVSKTAVEDLELSGALDLDGNGKADHVGGLEWNPNRNNIVHYGNNGDLQTTIGAAALQAERNGDGSITPNAAKKLFTTHKSENVKVTVTLWIEGWDRNVDSADIDADQLMYREVDLVDDVDGLYTYNDGTKTYTRASGKALAETTYYEVLASKTAFEGDTVPENTFIRSGETFVNKAGEAKDGGATYYSLTATAKAVVDAAHANPKDAGLLEVVDGNYVKTNDTTVGAKTYYKLLNADVTYSEYAPIDPETSLAATEDDKVSVVGLYTKDGNNNYLHASGLNIIATTYYQLTSCGQFENVPMWSGLNTDGDTFHFGLVFDVGANAFQA